MNFENEHQFFIDTLTKCHIHTAFLLAEDTADRMMDSFLTSIIGENHLAKATINDLLGGIEPKTEYRFVNELRLHFILPGE